MISGGIKYKIYSGYRLGSEIRLIFYSDILILASRIKNSERF